MITGLRAVTLMLASLVSLSVTANANEIRVDPLEKVRLGELRAAVERIRESILQKDPSGLLEYVQPEQDNFTFERIKRELHDASSWLYGNLFDTEVLRRHTKHRRLLSVRDYLLRARKMSIGVGFYEDRGKKRTDWGWATFRSSNFPKGQWPLATFSYSNGKWWITDLFEHEQ